ncbi:hypothetical protein MRB53_006183 [Persea americana]|uniref:Uncharacterized protein n=1 Tax=Persea americana TaxID=3435 RepID=A0ACC2MG83_PERAE|nr:hypothetical protein MRB53_006183 [Persea americana]
MEVGWPLSRRGWRDRWAGSVEVAGGCLWAAGDCRALTVCIDKEEAEEEEDGRVTVILSAGKEMEWLVGLRAEVK